MNETLLALESLAADNSDALGGTIHDASVSMQEMRKALKTVNEHLSSIMYNVEGGTRQLHEFAQAVRENPARLIRGSEPHDEAE
jgi:DNA repair ATPase RecN